MENPYSLKNNHGRFSAKKKAKAFAIQNTDFFFNLKKGFLLAGKSTTDSF